ERLEEGRPGGRLVEMERLPVELGGELLDRCGVDEDARVRREAAPGREILEEGLAHRRLISCHGAILRDRSAVNNTKFGRLLRSSVRAGPRRAAESGRPGFGC